MGSQFSKVANLPVELQEEKTKLDECLVEVLQEGVVALGEQGGYLKNKPQKTAFYLGKDVAYLESVSKENIEDELEDYVKENFGRCKDNLEVEDSAVKIENELIIAEAEMPVTLGSGDISARINRFNGELNFRLGTMLNIVENLRKDINCVSCLMDETG